MTNTARTQCQRHVLYDADPKDYAPELQARNNISRDQHPLSLEDSTATIMAETAEAFQERLVAIFVEAKAFGFNPRDIIPSEVQDHSSAAITILEQEKIEMNEKISDLEGKLKQSQQAAENIDTPSEMKQLQIDLKQAKNGEVFYQRLMKDAELRAQQYQDKMKEAIEKQHMADEVDKKMAHLEEENCNLRLTKSSLSKEMQVQKTIYDKLLQQSYGKLEDKAKKCAALELQLKEQEARYSELFEENRGIEEKYEEIMMSMDQTLTDTTTDLNASKELARAAERQRMATFSEIQPLRKFYAEANAILDMYQNVFKQLLNATDDTVEYGSGFQEDLSTRLQLALDSCQTFHTIRTALTTDGIRQAEYHQQLGEMGQSAQSMHKSLAAIGQDLTQFLWALTLRPDVVKKLIRYKYKILR